MQNLSRRQFLKTLAAGSGAILLAPVLSSCKESPETVQPTLTPGENLNSPTSAATKTPGEMLEPSKPQDLSAICSPSTENPCETPTVTSEPAQAQISNPDLVVARNGEPEDLVNRAISALGGIEKFVGRGDQVIIKPNMCTDYYSYEYAATTNPWVVGTLVKLCLAAGAKQVQVMDFPFGGIAKSAYVKSGIQEQVESAGGEMVLMSNFKYIETEIPEGLDIKKWTIYEDFLNSDVVINVPIAKHHGLARLTLGMKNLMGTVQNRESLHRNLGQRLADLASRIRPSLTVIDAVRILTANGPTGGNLDDVKKLDTIIASADIVAADAFATTLFDMKPENISYINAGAKMGLGKMDLENLLIAEV